MQLLMGEDKPLIEWAELYGISYKTVITRCYRGLRGKELIEPLKNIKKNHMHHNIGSLIKMQHLILKNAAFYCSHFV
jgi:hypothetical protein